MRAIAVRTFRAEPRLVEVPKPEPAAGEVRVKIEYAALNPLDWQTADGAGGDPDQQEFPLIIGVDFAGRVDMIGSGDNTFRVGDAVLGRVTTKLPGTGTYCEYVSVPQDSPIVLAPATCRRVPPPHSPRPGWPPPRSWRRSRCVPAGGCSSSARRAASAAA